MIALLQKKPGLSAGILVGLTLLVLYSMTAAQTPVGYADSDEFLSVGYWLGVAHPPGYPLLVVLTHLFEVSLVGFSSIAARGHWLSVVLMSASMGLMTIWFWQTIQRFTISWLLRWSLSIAAGLTVGMSVIVWRYGTVLEVVSLSAFLMMCLLLASRRLADYVTWRWWILMALLVGISIGHHQLLILFMPGLAVWIWPSWWEDARRWRLAGVGLALVFGGFLLSYGWLAWLGSRVDAIPVSWWFEVSDAGSWWRLFSRADYTGALIEVGQSSNAYLKEVLTGQGLIGVWHFYVTLLPRYITVLGLLLMIFGWYVVLFRVRDNWTKWGMIMHLLFLGIFVAYYIPLANTPDGELHNLSLAIAERFYVIAVIGLSLPLALGSGWLVMMIGQWPWLERKWWWGLGMSLALLVPVWVGIQAWDRVDLHSYDDVSRTMTAALKSLPEGAVLLCFSDLSCFTNQYLLSVDQVRDDVVLVPVTPQLQKRYLQREHPALQIVGYEDNPYRIGDLIFSALDQGRPVYVSQVSEYYINWLGLNGQMGYLQPGYIWHQVTCELPTDNSVVMPDEIVREPKSPWQQEWTDLVYSSAMLNGTLRARTGAKGVAAEDLSQALLLKPQDPQASVSLLALEDYEGDPNYKDRQACMSVEEIAAIAERCHPEDEVCLHQVAYWLTLKEPRNAAYRIKLAEHYERVGFAPLARREYEIVLQFAPDNQEAIKALEELENAGSLE